MSLPIVLSALLVLTLFFIALVSYSDWQEGKERQAHKLGVKRG